MEDQNSTVAVNISNSNNWVELQRPAVVGNPTFETGLSAAVNEDIFHKLLMEAQHESSSSPATSNESSGGVSPRQVPYSGDVDGQKPQDLGTDWVWDWSSGPEVTPASNTFSQKFQRPGKKPPLPPVNGRGSPAKLKPGFFGRMSRLLLTHACTFFLGAALMFIYLKKYCPLSVVHAAVSIN